MWRKIYNPVLQSYIKHPCLPQPNHKQPHVSFSLSGAELLAALLLLHPQLELYPYAQIF